MINPGSLPLPSRPQLYGLFDQVVPRDTWKRDPHSYQGERKHVPWLTWRVRCLINKLLNRILSCRQPRIRAIPMCIKSDRYKKICQPHDMKKICQPNDIKVKVNHMIWRRYVNHIWYEEGMSTVWNNHLITASTPISGGDWRCRQLSLCCWKCFGSSWGKKVPR